MKLLPVFALILTTSFAEDWQLANGRKYSDVKVTGRDDTTVTISHASGVSRLNWLVLTPETQASLGFDQSKYDNALAEEKERLANAAKEAQEWAKAVRIRVKVMEVASEGILTEPLPAPPRFVAPPLSSGGATGGSVEEFRSATKTNSTKEKPKTPVRPKTSTAGHFLLTGHPQQSSLVSGAIVDVDAVESGVYTDPPNTGRRLKKYRILKVHLVAE